MADKLCITICDHFAQETAAVAASEDFVDVEFVTFPAHCKRPEEAWETLAETCGTCEKKTNKVLILGGCRAKMGDSPKEMKAYNVWASEQCFYMVASRELVDAHLRMGHHLVTPGWLTHWRNHMEEWGFPQDMAREFFGESATQLALLDTGIDADAHKHLEEFAEFIGLPFEVVPVGLDYFRSFLREVVQEWRMTREKQKSAEYAMVFDILGNLPQVRSEGAVIDRIMDLFEMLCAPASLVYVPFTDGKAGAIHSIGASSDKEEAVTKRLALLDQARAWSESEDGFFLRIVHQDELVGGLGIEGLAFPEYREHYLNLALAVVAACGLAVANARANDMIEAASVEREKLIRVLQEAKEQIGTLRGIIPICAHCKNIRNDEGYWERVETYVRSHSEAEFSHGICPACRKQLYPELDAE